MSRSPRKTRRAARRRGFTLVELMVSLVAGLVIAIAVVGLAKAATTTFHEQARLSQVEATVRSAAERLRQDLTRISYMSTGNIKLAAANPPPPTVPKAPYGHRVGNEIGTITGSRYGGSTQDLAGLRIRVGGSRNNTVITTAGSEGADNLATNNGLNPDAIIITGNMTSDDSYVGKWRDVGSCGAVRIDLNATFDASVRRLLDPINPLASAQAAFMPQTAGGARYLARIIDKVGCQHYAEVCDVTVLPNVAQIHFSDAATGPAVPRTGSAAGGANDCGGAVNDDFIVSPVHRVRWYIGPNIDPALDPDPAIEPAANKFNLYRELLDANGNPLPAPGIREIVAEYAFDLKFGIVVDDPVTPAPNNIRVFDMDSDPGGGNIETWTQAPSATIDNGPGPQRVRAVRFRVATRAALPDRRNALVVLPVPGQPYISRYCIENASIATCTKFARARTIVSEVTLINQMGMSY